MDSGVPQNCVTLTRYFFSKVDRPDILLHQQLAEAMDMIDRVVTRPLLTYQREALICLLSDVVSGCAESPNGPFEKSFLLTALNKGMLQVAAAEFSVFCYRQGRVHQQAWQKRRAEQYLFLKGCLLF